MGKLSRTGLVSLLIVLILSGCSGSKREDTSGKLKIVTSFDRFTFSSYFGGNQFELAHPEYEVAYASANTLPFGAADYWDKYVGLLESEKPDVIAISNIFDYYKLLSAGLLKDMSAMVRKDGFDLDVVDPTILSLLQYPSEPNELFGLAPFFNPTAIYYNQTLFKKYGIPLPKSEMTWEEMLQLASRFPNQNEYGERLYGYHHRAYSTPGFYVDYFSGLEGLSAMEGDHLTMDDARWRTIMDELLQAVKLNAVSFAPNEGAVRYDDPESGGDAPFLDGRVAMIEGDALFMNQLDQRRPEFDWGIMPKVVSLDRSKSMPSYPSLIYAIYRDAPNVDSAWEFIRYMNDSATLKLMSQTVPQLPTQPNISMERLGRSLETFYTTKTLPPSIAVANKPMIVSPFFRSQKLNPIIDEEFGRALEGTRSVDAMIAAIRSRGQEAYDQALAEFRAGDNGVAR
ncbi:MAG: extracellular solute-binding protein [Cohnella sp.]|nr:extracellular solute-binding protein [Cohnella sp.]